MTGNQAGDKGGGVYIATNPVYYTVSNSVVFNNTATNAYPDAFSYGNQIGYCCLGDTNGVPNAETDGNMAANPRFLDAAGGNYRLRSDSPCINAGANQDWMHTGVDLDGQPRLYRTLVDLGAYERLYFAGAVFNIR